MRALLPVSVAVVCAAALAVPLSASATSSTGSPAADIPGSTRSLPLNPLSSTRSLSAAQGLPERDVQPFSLVGVVWDDAAAELQGTVQVRTRATGSTAWSGWQRVETHNHEHAADLGTEEQESSSVRGSTAPLWVGDSDGVEVRVQPDTGVRAAAPLPKGLRLELVDPGEDSGSSTDTEGPRATALSAEDAASSAVNAELAPLGAAEIPALDKRSSEDEAESLSGGVARPFVGPRPRIITRKGWGADEKLRERDFAYTKSVKAAFVHHSASGNGYSCAQSPSVLRSIYRYHVKSSGWRDIGYNFAVDKCGNIYEGRAGGVAKPVMGAHTLGFNTNSMGVAVLGTFTDSPPPAAAVNAVARLTAWKLGLYGANPAGKTSLISGGGNLYKKGRKVTLNVISGHRDGFATECPGGRLYKKLGKARHTSAHYQGR
ncbi:N-acetylmuramoyl-L-alanine amidase [Streptomyces sp. NPDC050738]|uniref:peptidoglycan recognition protein family protein n=1 Tax=Streptomyces sp. NPDC050738 TaxID=3154744 RepID=UPI00342C460C